MATGTQPNWMTPIKQYLTDGICDPHLEKTMKQQAVGSYLLTKTFTDEDTLVHS